MGNYQGIIPISLHDIAIKAGIVSLGVVGQRTHALVRQADHLVYVTILSGSSLHVHVLAEPHASPIVEQIDIKASPARRRPNDIIIRWHNGQLERIVSNIVESYGQLHADEQT